MNHLESFIPSNSKTIIQNYFDGTFALKIVKPRKTKLGDFRAPRKKGEKPTITINNDLNQYAFLVTLVHEIAHHRVYQKHSNRIQPHGMEWKATFKELMLPFLHPSILPHNVIQAISRHLLNTKASSCSDPHLYRILLSYNINTHPTLETLEMGTLFSINDNRVFQKGNKLRTRYKCTEIHSRRQYFVHGLAHVKIVDK